MSLRTLASSPRVLILPPPPPAHGGWQPRPLALGTEQESGRAGLIRSLSARDRRLIATLLVNLAWPSRCVHVCVCECVHVCVGESGLRLRGRLQGQGWVAQDFSASSEPCLVWCAAKRST